MKKQKGTLGTAASITRRRYARRRDEPPADTRGDLTITRADGTTTVVPAAQARRQAQTTISSAHTRTGHSKADN